MTEPAKQLEIELLTVPELAAILRVKPNTVYAMASQNELPGVRKVGRLVRFVRSEVEDWLATGRRSDRARGR